MIISLTSYDSEPVILNNFRLINKDTEILDISNKVLNIQRPIDYKFSADILNNEKISLYCNWISISKCISYTLNSNFYNVINNVHIENDCTINILFSQNGFIIVKRIDINQSNLLYINEIIGEEIIKEDKCILNPFFSFSECQQYIERNICRTKIDLCQYVYRYLPLFEQWNNEEEGKCQKYKENKIKFESIEEYLFDGTFNKLHDNGLLKYHKAGKPKKLAIKWHIKKSEYTAYFWFEDEKICSIFERFYGAHPDTKTDFIIRIDAEQKKYELALYRQGLKAPQIIPEDAYQLLVFKNKFEDYRSDNYNQERGAWIW